MNAWNDDCEWLTDDDDNDDDDDDAGVRRR